MCIEFCHPFGYGLSKIVDFSSITSTGTQIGSPLYMSPEQLKDSKHIDYRAGIYVLGVILYEMVTKNIPDDPSTQRLSYVAFGNTKGLVELPYSPKEETEARELLSALRNNFTIRIGNRLYAHKGKLDTWMLNQIL